MSTKIKIRIRSIWNGQVGIRDKYYKEALKDCKDILIFYNQDQMLIPFAELEQLTKGKSDRAFQDRFSHDVHYLYYFDWKPVDTRQQKLQLI